MIKFQTRINHQLFNTVAGVTKIIQGTYFQGTRQATLYM